jgi:hypothetical protein
MAVAWWALGSVTAAVPRAGAASPSPAQLEAAEALARTGAWSVLWDQETGSPASITEARTSVGAAHRGTRRFSPDSLATSFVRANAGLFPLRSGRDSLAASGLDSSGARARRNGIIYTIRLEQLYLGLPVEAGGYAVSMSPDGEVLSLNGRLYPGIELDPRPAIDAEESGRIAIQAIGAGADSVSRSIPLRVSRRDGQDHLVWAPTVPENPMHVWVVRVDAHDGRVIGRDNRVLIDPR